MTTTTSNLGLFKYVSSTDANLAFNITSALNNNWDIIDNSVMKGNIITLSGTSPTLTNNRAHKITITGTTTFSLPSGSSTEFKQMIVLLYMASAYSITLGPSGSIKYFGGSAPNMSSAGYYTIIYEYDSIQSCWVVGALKKA